MTQSCAVLFFGRLKETAGTDRMDLIVDMPCMIDDLIGRIADIYPGMADALRSERVRILVNGALVKRSDTIESRGEIAFLPPVSGG